jgi:hypothetical protein
MNAFSIFTVTVHSKHFRCSIRIHIAANFAILDIPITFHIPCCNIYILSPCTISLAPPQSSITHRHQITCAERHNTKHLSLCNSFESFRFILQARRDLFNAVRNSDVNNANRWVKCSNQSCTTNNVLRNTPLTYAAPTGQLSVVRMLLEGGANAETGNGNQQTVLHTAA